MRILFIGGTGTISSAITRRLASSGHELWLLNRGNRANEVPENVRQIVADINDEDAVSEKLGIRLSSFSSVFMAARGPGRKASVPRSRST